MNTLLVKFIHVDLELKDLDQEVPLLRVAPHGFITGTYKPDPPWSRD